MVLQNLMQAVLCSQPGAITRRHRHAQRRAASASCKRSCGPGMQGILQKASERFPQFEEHARFLNLKQGGEKRWGGLVKQIVHRNKKEAESNNGKPLANVTEDTEMTREQFKDLLKTIDLGLRGLPATAQARPAHNLTFWHSGVCMLALPLSSRRTLSAFYL